MVQKKKKKMSKNLNKYLVENCPTLSGLNLIPPYNRRVKSVQAGREEISSRQTEIFQSTSKSRKDFN